MAKFDPRGRKIKILATLGPASRSPEMIEKLLLGIDVPGWPTVVVSIMFFSGVQLLFIGILGEYLARVYEEVKGRPPYVVAEVVTPARPAADVREAQG